MKNILRFSFFNLFLFWVVVFAQAQNSSTVFSKSRVQHQAFDWKVVSSFSLDVYYYGDHLNQAQNLIKQGEIYFKQLTSQIGYTPYSKIKVFLYSNPYHLQQSNVGLSLANPGVGQINAFAKSVLEVAYPGSAVEFNKALKRGMAQTLIYEMLYGGNLQEMLRSSYFLTLPDWFIEGASLYLAEGWSIAMDNKMRDMATTGKLKNPSRLNADEAAFVGQSIWNYIVIRSGKSTIGNILNLTRIVRNEESSISNTLGLSYRRFLKDWRNFYLAQSLQAQLVYKMPTKDSRIYRANGKTKAVGSLCTNPNKNMIAWAETGNDFVKVKLVNLAKRDRKTLVRLPVRPQGQNNQTMPAICWLTNQTVAYVYHKRKELILETFDTQTRKKTTKKLTSQFDIVTHVAIGNSPSELVFAASKNGQADLYIYNLSGNKIKQLTNDRYDQIRPLFLQGKGIVYASNAPTDSAQTNAGQNYNLFLLQAGKASAPFITLPGNQTKPMLMPDGRWIFANNQAGVNNLTEYQPANSQLANLTTLQQNIEDATIIGNDKTLVFLLHKQRFELYSLNLPKPGTNWYVPQTHRNRIMQRLAPEQTNANPLQNSLADTQKTTPDIDDEISDPIIKQIIKNPEYLSDNIDIEYYIFEKEKAMARKAINNLKNKQETEKQATKADTKKQNTKKVTQVPVVVSQTVGADSIKIQGPYAYRPLALIEGVTSNFTVDPTRGWGLGLGGDLSDLFENHLISFGGNLFSDLSSYDAYVDYHYIKHRVDFSLSYKRNVIFFFDEGSTLTQRYVLNKAQAGISYPIINGLSITALPTYQSTTYKDMTDAYGGFEFGNQKVDYLGYEFRLNYNNTVNLAPNIKKGTRGLIQFEQHYGLAGFDHKNFGLFNIDIRHYQPIHKEFILALRGAYGRFFGADPKMFTLGGMDQWLLYDIENSDRPDDPFVFTQNDLRNDMKTDWLFMRFATSMRGFNYNTLFGNEFFLFNGELRMPVFRYLYNGPIESGFLRNFMIIGFTDVGAAWSGGSPFEPGNNYNTKTLEEGNFVVELRDYNLPLLVGYGWGARTELLNVYLKFDMAWGIQDQITRKPWYYVTLGYDF